MSRYLCLRGTVTSDKVILGKKAQSSSSWIWLCRATLQQQLPRAEERALSLSFFSSHTCYDSLFIQRLRSLTVCVLSATD